MGESGTNWNTAEEVQLCESWARVTVCPITGNAQTLPRLWQKVREDYVENWSGPTAVRTPIALQSHFKPLKKLLKQWHNAKLQARHHRPSGTNQLDEARQIQLEFIRTTNKQFVNEECWDAVKDHPYFKDPPTAPVSPFVYPTVSLDETETPIDLDTDVGLDTPTSSVGRPMGQKAAKEAKRKGKNKELGSDVALAILAINESNKKSMELLQKRDEERRAEALKIYQFEEAKEDARIMAMKTSDFSPDSREWYKKLKSNIMKKTNPNADCYRPLFQEPQSPQ